MLRYRDAFKDLGSASLIQGINMEGVNFCLAKVFSGLTVFITVHNYRQRFFHFSGGDALSLDKTRRGKIFVGEKLSLFKCI